MKKVILLFTLLIVFVSIIFISQTINAAEISKSEKRVQGIEQYLKNLEKFKDLKSEKAQRAYKLASENLPQSLEQGRRCLVETDTQKREACKTVLAEHYVYAKRIYRLIKYYAVAEAKPVVCVKADLGVGLPAGGLKARGFNSKIAERVASGEITNPKETGRTEPLQVFLCSDSKGNKKLRVQDSSGTWLPLAPEEKAKPEFQIGNLPPAGNLEELEKELNI